MMEGRVKLEARIGKYTIEGNLGYGKTAEVKLGRDPQGQLVALKLFRQQSSL